MDFEIIRMRNTGIIAFRKNRSMAASHVGRRVTETKD